MTLTFQKLNKFLMKNNLTYLAIFHRGEMCTHVEVISSVTGEVFLLYIPSKYDIAIDKHMKDVYNVDYIDVSEEGVVAEDYAEQMNPVEVHRAYEGVMEEAMRSGDDLTATLEENYRHQAVLSDVVKNDMRALKNIFRQLKRLRLSVQNVKYKISLIYKNYICSIRRDDSLEGFSISDYVHCDRYRLLITIDLESLYDKLGTVNDDIKMVRESIYLVLSKNQMRHANNLDQLLLRQRHIKDSSNDIQDKKQYLEERLRELQEMLYTLSKTEKSKYAERNVIEGEYQTGSGVHQDMVKGKAISDIDKSLRKLDELRQEIIANIMECRLGLENLALRIDIVFFDNSIMLDEVSRNFTSLEEAV